MENGPRTVTGVIEPFNPDKTVPTQQEDGLNGKAPTDLDDKPRLAPPQPNSGSDKKDDRDRTFVIRN